jgi:hypothetical protein
LEWLGNASRANIPATNQFDLQKKIGSPYVTQDCVKVEHGLIQGLRNLGIEGILSILIY